MRDRTTIAIVGAGLAAVAVILVIIFAAIQPIPDFAPLAESDETGYVAYVRDVGGDPGEVAIVDLASGRSVVVDMGREAEVLGFGDDGNLVMARYGPQGEQFLLVDPATGEQVGTLDPEAGQRFFEAGEPVWVDHEDGRIVLELEPDGQTASFVAPDAYQVPIAAPMGDDRVVFVDSLGRVAVTGFGEDVVPVLVADDALEWWRVAARTQ